MNVVASLILLTVLASTVASLWVAQLTLKRSGATEEEQRRSLRLLAVLLFAWATSALVLGWTGFFATIPGVPQLIPNIAFSSFPAIAGVLLMLRNAKLRRVIAVVPQARLILIQSVRMSGVLMLVESAAGRLPPVFAVPAGLGGVWVALFGLWVSQRVSRAPLGSRGWILAWNVFGLADLAVATTLGAISGPGPLQILALDLPSTRATEFPLVLIPAFIVPLSLLLHACSLVAMRARTKLGAPEAVASLI